MSVIFTFYVMGTYSCKDINMGVILQSRAFREPLLLLLQCTKVNAQILLKYFLFPWTSLSVCLRPSEVLPDSRQPLSVARQSRDRASVSILNKPNNGTTSGTKNTERDSKKTLLAVSMNEQLNYRHRETQWILNTRNRQNLFLVQHIWNFCFFAINMKPLIHILTSAGSETKSISVILKKQLSVESLKWCYFLG